MKKWYVILIFLFKITHTADDTIHMKEPVVSQHSNIHLQKITNNSHKNIFIALERTHIMPLGEPIEIAGHIMPQKDMELKDPEGIVEAAMIPVWGKTFRGSTINIVTLDGKPGRIYYLYTINGNLFAIKAPEKEGELKGVHLLEPAEHDRRIELVVHPNNILQAYVLQEDGSRSDEKTHLTFEPKEQKSEPFQGQDIVPTQSEEQIEVPKTQRRLQNTKAFNAE